MSWASIRRLGLTLPRCREQPGQGSWTRGEWAVAGPEGDDAR